MKKIVSVLLALPVLVTLSGCALTGIRSAFSQDQLASTVELARQRAITDLSLTDLEKVTIQNTSPDVGYYILGGTDAQYFFCWELPTDMIVSVHGLGDILTLENAKVDKVPNANQTAEPVGLPNANRCR